MHIVSILTSLTSGGAEILVVNLSKEYVANGHRSTVVALVDAESVGNSAEMERNLRERIVSDGGAFRSLQLRANRNPVTGWSRLRKLFASLRPDIIHAHTARSLPMLYPAPRTSRVVLTHHNSRLGFSPHMFKLFDRVVDTYVAISKETEELFSRHARNPVVHIPNAASRSFAAGRARDRIEGKPRILSVGAVSAQKHYDLLIEVAADMVSRCSASDMPTFQVAGGGAALEAMRALARDRGVGQHVLFLGERSDIAELMQNSDLYLNTSRYEGMPVALLEAMASGLPIVATRVPGNSELVVNERNGFLCPLDEPAHIAGAIARITADETLYAACSRAALEMSSTFSIEATANRHLTLYHRLAAAAGFSGPDAS
ncbi:glycosyltransferase family 4 protein [Sphingopyxis sp.]|uniref:glycosyltransferase family 4 protein n=1 Tax=Sphingopyxis sp. TaxID=1908224 RepID=UPI003D14B01C